MEENNKKNEEEILVNKEETAIEEKVIKQEETAIEEKTDVSEEETVVIQDEKIQNEETIVDTEKSKDIKTKKTSKLHIIFVIIALAFIAITSKFCMSIIQTDMIPTAYIIAFVAFEAIITLPIIIGLVKKHKTIVLNIFCLVLVAVMSIAYIFATHYIDATMKFFRSIFAEVEEIEEYYVVVGKDSNYNNIKDIEGKEIHFFQIEDNIKNEIQGKVSVTLNETDNLLNLGELLLKNEIEIILVSSAQYGMFVEEIANFSEGTKIINTEMQTLNTQAQVEDVNSQYNLNNGVFNIYISGIDTYGNISNVSRSDANMIVTVNTNTHKILLTSIPRDYYVTLHSKNEKDKLTHSGIYGINETIATVEDFMDIEINYYVRVNFTTLIKLVDTLGGVDVYSDYSFSSGKYSFNKGYNHLNGEEALVFSRERYSFKEGDNQRIKNQQRVLEAILNKALNNATILKQYTEILDSLENCFNTNIDINSVNELIKYQLAKMPYWEIKAITLAGSDAMKTTYSAGSAKRYVMIPNQNSINEAREAIQEVMGD